MVQLCLVSIGERLHLLPVVDRLDVDVFCGVPGRRDVAHADFFALVDVEGAAEGGLHEGEELGSEGTGRVAVVGVALEKDQRG